MDAVLLGHKHLESLYLSLGTGENELLSTLAKRDLEVDTNFDHLRVMNVATPLLPVLVLVTI